MEDIGIVQQEIHAQTKNYEKHKLLICNWHSGNKKFLNTVMASNDSNRLIAFLIYNLSLILTEQLNTSK